MKYAVIVSGGKQYKITEGETIDVERITPQVKGVYIFDTVLLYRSNDTFLLGKPNLTGIAVKATVIGDIKGKKIRVATFKSKVRERRVHGHRQHLTRVRIDSISVSKTPQKTAARSAKQS